MYFLRSAIVPIVLFSAFVAAFPVLALPVDAENPCYMKTASGQILNLTQSLCGVKARPSNTSTPTRPVYRSKPSTYSTGVSSVVTTVHGGVTTTIYSAPGYGASSSRYVYPNYDYSSDYNDGYSPNSRQSQTSSSVRQ
ncbi:MAG: hypothetical protein ACAF41_08695 [Leptolyngbya sp. BL-A-14]